MVRPQSANQEVVSMWTQKDSASNSTESPASPLCQKGVSVLLQGLLQRRHEIPGKRDIESDQGSPCYHCYHPNLCKVQGLNFRDH